MNHSDPFVRTLQHYLQQNDIPSAHYIARKYFPNTDPIELMEQWAQDINTFNNDYSDDRII